MHGTSIEAGRAVAALVCSEWEKCEYAGEGNGRTMQRVLDKNKQHIARAGEAFRGRSEAETNVRISHGVKLKLRWGVGGGEASEDCYSTFCLNGSSWYYSFLR